MKLLYFVDFDHPEAHGHSVTGATYRKLPHAVIEKEGPVNLCRPFNAKHVAGVSGGPDEPAKGRLH
jgi:hypothetical protein